MSLYTVGGFAAVAAATALIPLLTLLLVVPLQSVSAVRGKPAEVLKVAGAVWMPGLGSALSSLGYGAILAFSSLLATERGWNPVWLIFTAFAFALVAARLFLGHLPDRLGGARVALACVMIEAVGLGLLWLAPGLSTAALGGALTGFGYSLVYPALGVEAVRRAPPQSRGLAMGAYTVFLDVALGFGSPVLGLIAGWAGLSPVFLVTAFIVTGAAVISARLLSSSTPSEGPR
jgi:MFS family permease